MPVILATRDYARWLGERGHLRKNPGMNSVMTLGVVLLCFGLMRQWPRKAIWAKIMTSGIIAFTKRSNALIPKVRAAILPIVAPPQGDRSEKRKKYAPQ